MLGLQFSGKQISEKETESTRFPRIKDNYSTLGRKPSIGRNLQNASSTEPKKEREAELSNVYSCTIPLRTITTSNFDNEISKKHIDADISADRFLKIRNKSESPGGHFHINLYGT